MKTFCAVVIVLLWSAQALCGETEIEFSGVLVINGHTKLALTDKSAGVTRWIEIGGTFAGFVVTTYDAKEEIALLTRDETHLRLHLVSARVQASLGELAPEVRQAIEHNLQQIVAVARRFYLDNARLSANLADLVGPDKPIKELIPAAGEKYDELTLTMTAKVFSVTTESGVVVSYEPTEPTEFLREYIVRAGDTFAKIARNSGISLSQLVELNPGVNSAQLKIGQKLRMK